MSEPAIPQERPWLNDGPPAEASDPPTQRMNPPTDQPYQELVDFAMGRRWRAQRSALLSLLGAISIWRFRRSHNRIEELGTVAVLVGTSVATPLRLAARRYRTDQSSLFRAEAQVALGAAFDIIVRETELRPADFGLDIFIIQQRLMPPWRRYLGPTAEVRLAGLAPHSGIEWTKGKGVIGTAWSSGEIVVCDTAGLYEPYTEATEWESAPAYVRMDLSFVEALALRARYSGVVAVPVRDEEDRVRGVVALNTLVGFDFADVADDDSDLGTILDTLIEVGGLVSESLERVPRWVYPR